MSDSAYKVEGEGETRAMVGRMSLLMGSNDSGNSPFGACSLIDFECRRQKRVCRSTFAAEIRGLNDALERGRVVQLAFEEVYTGPISATLALKMEEHQPE